MEIFVDPNRTEEHAAVNYELAARGALGAFGAFAVEAESPPAPKQQLVRPASAVPSSGGSDAWGCFVVPAAVVVWLLYVMVYAPRHREPNQEIPKDCTLYTELVLDFPTSWPRVELMGAGNVNIYMSRPAFEAVPYPDRSPVVKRVGETWDKHTHWYTFATIRIRDIQTGDDLATYSCTTGNVTLEKKGWF